METGDITEMNVYSIDVDVMKYRSVFGKDGEARRDLILRPQAKCYGAEWKTPVYEERDPSDEGYNFKHMRGDFVGLGGTELGLRGKALQGIRDTLNKYGELLPIKVEGDPELVYWFNPTKVIDVVDWANSKPRWLDPDKKQGIILGYDEYAFFSGKIGGCMLFQLPKIKTEIFCIEPFKRHIEELGLTGLDFHLKWSDEPEGIERLRQIRLREKGASLHTVN